MRRNFIISIDLGGTNLKSALLTTGYQIKDRDLLSTRRFNRKEDLTCGILHSINYLREKNNIKKSLILGVGLGLPGPVDAKRGIVHFFPNIPGWKEVCFKRILSQRLDLPVFLDNDAKLMALAEYKLGAAKGFKNSLCLTLGTGVGGGLILDGKLYRGANNASGEIGHLPIDEEGPQCNCGGSACLEAFIGNANIMREGRIAFGCDISLEELGVMAKNGNKKARDIWLKVGGRLGVALTAAVNLLNLDAVIIGGGIANVGRILFDTVKRTVTQRAMTVQAANVRILKAKLGNNAGLIGAAVLVKEST